jgi:tetratricopeptide (TPR) repeat protein
MDADVDQAGAAVDELRRRVVEEGRRDLEPDLAASLGGLGKRLHDLGSLDLARQARQEALAICRRLVEQEGRSDLKPELAACWAAVGSTLHALGGVPAALEARESACRMYQRLVGEGRNDLEENLAFSWAAVGATLGSSRDLPAALHASDEALRIYARLVEQDGRKDLEPDLAKSLEVRAATLHYLGNLPAAREAHETSLALYRRLVEQDGREDLEPDLAWTWGHLGVTLCGLREFSAARDAQGRALGIYRRLAERGRKELEPDLAEIWHRLGITHGNMGRPRAARTAFGGALRIYRRLVEEDGRKHLEDKLAETWLSLVVASGQLGDLPGARKAQQSAFHIYRRLVDEDGRRELEPMLAQTWDERGVNEFASGGWREAADAFSRSVQVLSAWVESGHRFLEEDLVWSWMFLAKSLVRAGEFAQAEDQLFFAADAVPHVQALQQGGMELYFEMLVAAELPGYQGNLPYDEIAEGCTAFFAKLERFHDGTCRGDLVRARFVAEVQRDRARAIEILRASAERHGRSEPYVLFALAELLRDGGEVGEAWSCGLEGVRDMGALIREERHARADAELPALLRLLVEGGLLAARCGFLAISEPVARQHDVLDVVHETVFDATLATLGSDGDADAARKTWVEGSEGLKKACRAGLEELRAEISHVRIYQRVLESCGNALLGTRWAEVQERLRSLARRCAAGAISPDEAADEAARDGAAICDTREVSPRFRAARAELARELGVDVERDCTEVASLAAAMALSAVAQERAADLPPAETATMFLALAGRAVEGALGRRLFEPYRAAVASGDAEGIAISERIFAQWMHGGATGAKLMLGAMATPWGKLVAHPEQWARHPEVGALARWIDAHFADPALLRDPSLNVLNAVRELRNRAAHPDDVTPPMAEEMRRLLLQAPALLVRLYRAWGSR